MSLILKCKTLKLNAKAQRLFGHLFVFHKAFVTDGLGLRYQNIPYYINTWPCYSLSEFRNPLATRDYN